MESPMRLALSLVLALTLLPTRSAAQEPPAGGFDLTKLLFSQDLVPTLETVLAVELSKRVAEADRWEVKLGREGNDFFNGKIGQLNVTGVNIRMRDGLVLAEASLHVKDLKIDLKSGAIQSVGEGVLTGRVGAEAISRFARQRAGDKVKELTVGFRGDRLEVSGMVDYRGFGIPVEVVGKPQLGEESIDFKADRLSVAAVKVPKLLVRELERRVNPIVDFRGLKIPARVMRVAVENDRLVAEAKLDFSAGPLELKPAGSRRKDGRRARDRADGR